MEIVDSVHYFFLFTPRTAHKLTRSLPALCFNDSWFITPRQQRASPERQPPELTQQTESATAAKYQTDRASQNFQQNRKLFRLSYHHIISVHHPLSTCCPRSPHHSAESKNYVKLLAKNIIWFLKYISCRKVKICGWISDGSTWRIYSRKPH